MAFIENLNGNVKKHYTHCQKPLHQLSKNTTFSNNSRADNSGNKIAISLLIKPAAKTARATSEAVSPRLLCLSAERPPRVFIIIIVTYFLILIAGVLATSLAFPSGIAWFGFLGWVCLSPIIYINEKLSKRFALPLNWFFFFLLFISLFWLNPAIEQQKFTDGRPLILLSILLIIFPALFAIVLSVSKWAGEKYPAYFRPFVYAAFWTSFEFFLTLFPWLQPLSFAITQARTPFFLQLVPITGIYGVSFLLLLVNAYLALYFYAGKKLLAAAAVLIFCSNLAYGAWALAKADQKGNLVEIGLIQPNITWQKSQFLQNKFFQEINLEKLYRLSKKTKGMGSPALLIWPELSADCYFLQSSHNPVEGFARELKTPLLIGTLFYKYASQKPANVAALISEAGNNIGMHEKHFLFPFTESSFYQKGGSPAPLAFDRSRINNLGVMLCFESLFPQIAGKLAREGANVLILMANGAWFGKSRWPWMHMSFSPFRALENNRWVIHLNNTGPSAAISPQGVFSNILPPAKTAVAMAKVESRKDLPFYAKSDDLFPKAILAFSIFVAFL